MFPLSHYFDEETMSIHIKDGVSVKAKKGKPGNWELVDLSSDTLSAEDVKGMIKEILELSLKKNGIIEINKQYSKVAQIEQYRVVIVEPPVSNGYEITVTRPLKKLSFKEYHVDPELEHRLLTKSEGVLIAGRPGEGKSTFAQALIEIYDKQHKIIKTIEAPRDLKVAPHIVQYSLFHADLSEIHDILLLSRPDYTFFDEVRNTADFELFKDLRLTGIGMVGVIHGAKPIDAIQRFIGKIELGMIPEVVDTLIFIEKGEIQKAYELNLAVKVPKGMMDSDLSRPVIVISDFITREAEYELYTFGNEVVVQKLTSSNSRKKHSGKSSHWLDDQDEENQFQGKETFPKMMQSRSGMQFMFEKGIEKATLIFENGKSYDLYPDHNGYVKIGKKGKLPDLLRKKRYKVYKTS